LEAVPAETPASAATSTIRTGTTLSVTDDLQTL
jgi:hypothetical protein